MNILQKRYNCFVQEINKDILRKEGFSKGREKFVKAADKLICSVAFEPFFDKNDKKNETIRFQIYVEVRFENETQLRGEKRLMTGEGAYHKLLPDLSKQDKWIENMQQAFLIHNQTDMTELKAVVGRLLKEALYEAMQFQTKEDLVAYLNNQYMQKMTSATYERKKYTAIAFLVYGVLGISACIVARDGFPLTFVSMIYYAIIIEDTNLPWRWIRRMVWIPTVELLAAVVLAFLLWSKVTDNFVIGGVCIGLLFSGLVHLVCYGYHRYCTKQNGKYWKKYRKRLFGKA